MKPLYVSHSPTARYRSSLKWFKPVKDKNSIGGNIVANAIGKTKEEAEDMAKKIAALPELIDALEKIAAWQSFQDHPIGKYAKNALDKLK